MKDLSRQLQPKTEAENDYLERRCSEGYSKWHLGLPRMPTPRSRAVTFPGRWGFIPLRGTAVDLLACCDTKPGSHWGLRRFGGRVASIVVSSWRLLRKRSWFRSLWSARVVSFSGDIMARTALMLYVQDIYGSGTAVGVLLLALALPRLLGPIAGTVADRVDQRRLMMASDLGQIVIIGAVVWFLPPFPLLVGLVASSTVLSALFFPAGRAVIPELVGHDELGTANSLVSTGTNLGLAVGPAVAGFLFGSVGIRGTLALDVASFVVSLLLLSRLPPLPPDSSGGQVSFWVDVQQGLMAIGPRSVARATTIGLLLLVSFLALDSVATIFLARDVLAAGPEGYGLLESAWGMGMILGSLTMIRVTQNVRAGSLLVAGAVISGVGVLSASVSPTIYVAVVVFAVGGIGNGVQNVATDTLIQEHVTRRVRGRVFGLVYSGALAGDSLASFVGGPLLDITSARWMLAIAGAGALAVAGLILAMMPSDARGLRMRPEADSV